MSITFRRMRMYCGVCSEANTSNKVEKCYGWC